ncbi:MAG: nitrile hydratase accessory protein [Actinomycetota bacterium]
MTSVDGANSVDLDALASQLRAPMANGEVVFTHAWQSRVFAATVRLRLQERFEWDEFRDRLIAEIATHEGDLTGPADYDYWGCWLRAFEGLITDLDLVDGSALASTREAIATRAPDHV